LLSNMNWFIENIKNKNSFAFSRFNDGEMIAIERIGSVVARGDQYVDATLSKALKKSILHKQKNYYVGIPCSLCYPRHNTLAKHLIGEYEYITHAVVTTNKNWKKFIEEFPKAMSNREMIWIGGKDQDVEPLKNMGLNIIKTVLVPHRNSWDYYDKIKEKVPQFFKKDLVVGISLGPTARVLAQEWFQENPQITFIDMGSNFDPFTRNVRHNCHKGWKETGFNLAARCKECN